MMPGEISSMQTSGAKLKVKKDSSVPERRQKQTGMWVKTQFKQSESEEEVDARLEFGGHHVCSVRLPLFPSCLLWCLSVSLTVSLLLCLCMHLSVLLYFLSQCLSLPYSLCVSPSLSVSPPFLYCSSVCPSVFLSSSCLLSTYYILQSVLNITTHINTMITAGKEQ